MSLKEVLWLGDSKLVTSSFTVSVKENLGLQLYELQKGWYRVIYTLQINNKIYVLHSFKKQSANTSKTDLELAKKRLKSIV